MNQSAKLTEGAIFVAIFTVMTLATFIPLLSLFVIILLPVPFVIYTSRHGVQAGMIVLIASSIITMLFFTIFSLPLTIMMGIGGLCIGHAIYKKRSAYETWGYGILGFIFGLLFTVAVAQLLFNVNFASEFESMAMEQMQTYLSIVESIGMTGGETNVDFETIFQEQIRLMINLIPAVLVFTAMFMAFVVQWVSYRIINRINKKAYQFPPFRTLKLPASVLWLYLIIILISFIGLDSSGIFYIGVQNALIILEMLLVIQGFSFIFFFADHRKMSKAVPVISIVLTVLFPIFLLSFVRILGIIDIGLNLRERMKKNNQNGN